MRTTFKVKTKEKNDGVKTVLGQEVEATKTWFFLSS
jgi:hypothetical protein